MTDLGDGGRLVFGAGLIGENLHLLSPAQRRNYELEQEQLAKDLESRRFAQEQAQKERVWLAAQRGETGHSVEEGALAAFAAQDRADRRQAASQHSADCGCDRCGTRLYGSGLAEHPDAWKAQREREQRAAKNREQLAMMPASNAQLAGVEHKVSKLESALSVLNLKRKLLGH